MAKQFNMGATPPAVLATSEDAIVVVDKDGNVWRIDTYDNVVVPVNVADEHTA